MSEEENKSKGEGIVKPYLGFIDTNVLFKKPVSCLFAIISLLVPVFFLVQFIQYFEYFKDEGKIIVASILLLLVLGFAGIFGAFIWWHRRINRDEGPKVYDNFRRFIQTIGECTGTTVAIVAFGGVLILMTLLKDTYYMITGLFPIPIPPLDLTHAFIGPIIGFLIIIGTKILLFLLDPLIWLIKQIWKLFVRIVLYCYRCVLNYHGTIERNLPIWTGVTWLFACLAVFVCIGLCFILKNWASAIALVASLAFLGFIVYKRKHDDAQ